MTTRSSPPASDPPPLRPSPPAPPPGGIAPLKQRAARARAELTTALSGSVGPLRRPGEVGLALGRRNAQLHDDLISSLLIDDSLFGPNDILAAVGSYGRGAVALHSDLDLRLVIEDDARAEELVDALIYPLWDAGVSCGHQLSRADELIELARTDLTVATSLLDWRWLAGSEQASAELSRRMRTGLLATSALPDLFGRIREEVSQRHDRFGGSVYLLEPDVKNGAGGLRDLDVARWAARARFGHGELDELVRIGVIVPREAQELGQASELLWRIRNLLHHAAGRRSDRLTFDQQEAIAPLLGYGDGTVGVERLMSEYYRSARSIRRGVDMMLARATPVLRRRRPKDEDLGGGLHMFDGAVTLADSGQIRHEPALALRLVSAAVERGVPLLPFIRDAIATYAADPAWCESLRTSQDACMLFRRLLVTRKETALESSTVPRELHELGLLTAMIPEFLPVVGRVHHDTYHVYTVDVHSVAAVDRLAALVRGDLTSEFVLASRLAAEIANPQVLFFATLLHDVGKAIGRRDHSERGAELSEKIMLRFGFSEDERADAADLILNHLRMYNVATKRDVDDPATVEDFCRTVRDAEGLRNLYLLTVADISTTSPTSMTSWKARMLDELFIATQYALAGSTPGQRLRRLKAEAMAAASALPARDERERRRRHEFLEVFLNSMPDRYLYGNAADAVASHAEVARRHHDEPVSLALVPSRHPEAAELCVVALDRPGLLANIAAAVSGSRLEVLAAQVFSRTTVDGQTQAVDLFWVRDRTEGVEGVSASIPRLARDLNDLLTGARQASDMVPSRSSGHARHLPHVRTNITIDNRAAPRHTVIEVTTRDQSALLYRLAHTMYEAGLTISLAKLATEGQKVADVFYVTDRDGEKLSEQRREAVEEKLLAMLEAHEREHAASREPSGGPPASQAIAEGGV